MISSLVRAAEPYLKAFSLRVVSGWKGNHVVNSDLGTAAAAVIPWGFVSQQKIIERVTPERGLSNVEKRAEHLNLDTWEFLRGTEEAYRCAARLFAPPPPPPPLFASADPASAHSGGCRGSSSSSSGGVSSHHAASERGRDSVGGGGRGGGSGSRGGGDRVCAVEKGLARELASVSAGLPPPSTDFLEFDVASPQMSMFLNDVLESYRSQGLVPRLSVAHVEARLCNVGVRLGGISKNTNFMGLMSADEVKYHLTMGMLGPEGAVINELEGRAPQKVIAEVELKCVEEFVLEDEAGKVVHGPGSGEEKVHYLTLQSNTGDETDLEWQITNINDVIKPTFGYYFSRFGH